ncbi:MAG TPA: hypothetical protein VHO95_02770, partial [Candidatus Dormibacteraeota bacterium]|nr:hypothetical protein [Candidatus Dormibacteraeota bacterium]
MPDLERQLTALGASLEWPATPPHLWGGVRRRRTEGPWRRWYLAAAAAIVIAALVVYSPTREAIAAWINLHTVVQRVEHLPTPSPLPPGPLGKRLGLGSETTLAGAQSQLAWKVVVPASLGAPNEVYLQ